MKKGFIFNVSLLAALVMIVHCDVLSQVNFVWGKQFGSQKEEIALIPVADQAGNIYIAGMTQGDLSGNAYGNADGFLAKLDSLGNVLWIKQFGTNENDVVNGAAIDMRGNVYLTGGTNGVANNVSYGMTDIWAAKFDSSGNIQWQQQYGTDSVDTGNGIYADATGDIYITGMTKGRFGNSSFGRADCFLLKLNDAGNKIFAVQFGTTEDDICSGVTEDAASIMYVCGNTYGDLAGKNKGKTDAFVGQFTQQGEQITCLQFGTDSYDRAAHTVIDAEGNIFVGGSTGGDLSGNQHGEGDCYLAKINKDGERVWTRQFGTDKWDGVLGMDLNEQISHNIVISGCQHWPACQSFIRMYSSDGNLLWIRNSVATGPSGGTCGKGVCFDKNGNVYHTGMTGGNLFNTILGEHDVFVVKYEVENKIVKP